LSVLRNYFNDPKLFSDLYLIKFLDSKTVLSVYARGRVLAKIKIGA